MRAIRQQISGAINVIVHVGRQADGRRKIVSIAEITGFDDPTIALQELFVSEASAAGGDARGWTRLMPTGIRPQIMDKIYRLGLAGPELGRVYPKNSAGVPATARRSVTSADGGGVPERDRRHS